MKLRTNIEVTYNNGVTGQESGIVEGILQDGIWLNDFNAVGANYTYQKLDGTVIHKNGFTIEGESIQTMWNAVKGNVPSNLDYNKTARYSFYLGFMFEMANTFGIDVANIEIVE